MIDKTSIISNIKLLVGISDSSKDNLISLLVDKAITDIKTECNDDFLNDEGIEDIPEALGSVIEDLVVYRYNRMGTEGYKIETLGDHTIHFESGIPSDILRRLYKYRQLRVW